MFPKLSLGAGRVPPLDASRSKRPAGQAAA
jgi:hypothetical protein